MYPLSDVELSLGDLTQHWESCRDDRRTASDLASELLKRFWLGRLPLRAPLNPKPWERHELLAAFRALPEAEAEELFMPSDLALGEYEFEFPPRVRLPTDPSAWTDEALEQAYAVMAERRIWQYTPASGPALNAFLVHRDDFAGLCDREGWPRPSFWFRTQWPSQGARSTREAVRGCREWLRAGAKANAPMRPKAQWCEEALRRFPGLTKRAFDRTWAKEAPAAWRRSGRRPGT